MKKFLLMVLNLSELQYEFFLRAHKDDLDLPYDFLVLDKQFVLDEDKSVEYNIEHFKRTLFITFSLYREELSGIIYRLLNSFCDYFPYNVKKCFGSIYTFKSLLDENVIRFCGKEKLNNFRGD